MDDKTPDYYDKPGMETIEKQEDVLLRLVSFGENPVSAFSAATAVKYVDRMGEKGDDLTATRDRSKAANYLYRYKHGRWPWDEEGPLNREEVVTSSASEALGTALWAVVGSTDKNRGDVDVLAVMTSRDAAYDAAEMVRRGRGSCYVSRVPDISDVI